MAKKEVKEWRHIIGLQNPEVLQKCFNFLVSIQELHAFIKFSQVEIHPASFFGDTGRIEAFCYKEDADLMNGICLAIYHQNTYKTIHDIL